MSSLCQDLKARYKQLEKLTTDLTNKYQLVRDSGDLGEVRMLRQKLEKAREALLEYLPYFIVPDANNPYYEALLEAGLDESQTQKQEEITLDIRKEVQRQLAVYAETRNAAGNPLLEEWIRDITEREDLIYIALAKDHEKIIERIKEGMIPIVMPGRSVQERTWEAALKYLQPTWIENGKKVALDEKNYLYGAYKTDSTKKMTREGFFKDIPDRPYLVWVKPTQGPDPKTMNKSFDEQQVLYAKMVADDTRGLYDSTDLIPTEYVALQVMATSQIRELFKELQGGTRKPTTIKPLDNGTSYTHFLSAGPFSDGRAPGAFFYHGDPQLKVGYDYPDAFDGVGFRPAARS